MDIVTKTCDRGWPLAEAFLRAADIERIATEFLKFLRKAGGRQDEQKRARFLFRLADLRLVVIVHGLCAWGDFTAWSARLTQVEVDFLMQHLSQEALGPFVDAYTLLVKSSKASALS